MMSVVACVTGKHNLWLVLLAALVCTSGSWAIIRLFQRAASTKGLQSLGWHFLTATAAGCSIWCTHFIAMLAYEPGAPVTFDPVLTIISLLVAIGGSLLGFTIAASGLTRLAPIVGGSLLGLAISAMHYTGMIAYRVQGIMEWDMSYLVASVVLSVVLSAISLHVARLGSFGPNKVVASGVLVLAIVSLHFTAMAAFRVTPLAIANAFSDQGALHAMALAIALVGLIIIGTGLASYLIDDRTRADSYQQLRHMALNDNLTGLPNRASFNERLDQEIGFARGTNGKLALVCIDLDRFKEVNDLRGHSAGDEVLRILALRMSNLLREGEFAARLGGDEFAAIHRMKDHEDLVEFLSRVEAALFKPIRMDDYEVTTGASIGVALYPDNADTKEMLVNNGDLAMYRAKADVTKAICFYEQSMDETVRARRTLAGELREALDNNQLDLHYQVQTSVSTGEVRGYEVLLRWNHPKHGFIPPSEFIPLAEETGLILQMGEWVLRTACTTAATWTPRYKIAVNLSPVQFAHSDLPKLIHEILLETRLPANRLELELTESTIISDKICTLDILRRIKALGVTIALDDFGTGYSSLDTLRAFPFDTIKLDRSFMREVETSPQAKAIIRAVLALGTSLSIPVLAEGIETQSQLSILDDEGCDAAQGFFLGRPAPLEQIMISGQITMTDTGTMRDTTIRDRSRNGAGHGFDETTAFLDFGPRMRSPV